MKIRNFVLTSVAVLFCAATISAQSSHTWVSGSGSDSNACTFASPCATFQEALAKTSAGGVITAKDAGDFGAMTIGQSVTIDGNNISGIAYTGAGGGGSKVIYISAAANVILQNLTINGMGSAAFGIYVENGLGGSGGTVTIDNCKIMNITIAGIYFDGAWNLTVTNSRIGSFSSSNNYVNGIEITNNLAQNLVVKDTVIDASPLSAGNYGIDVDGITQTAKASLQNVTIMNAGGAAVVIGGGVTEITGSVLTQSGTGVLANNNTTISVANSMITANTTGVCSHTGAKIRLDSNDIYDNTTAIANCGGTYKTSGTNKTSGAITATAAEVSDSVLF